MHYRDLLYKGKKEGNGYIIVFISFLILGREVLWEILVFISMAILLHIMAS